MLDTYADLGLAAPGGNAVNVGVFAQRLGAFAAYVGVIGDDAAGDLVGAALRAEGLDLSRMRVVHGPNAIAVVRHVDHDRFFGTGSRGVSIFRLESEDLDYLATFDVVHTCFGGQLESWAGEIAERSLLSYDFTDLSDEQHVASVAPHCWLGTFSGSDLDDQGCRARIESALALGVRYVLLTRGDRGALLASPDGVWSVDAVHVEIEDTLGAGDAFIASTIVGLFAGNDPQNVLARAAMDAADVCTRYGAFGHLTELVPTLSKISNDPTPHRQENSTMQRSKLE